MFHRLIGFGLMATTVAIQLPSQSVTATAVATSSLTACAGSTTQTCQSLPAGTDLTSGASLTAGTFPQQFETAAMLVSLTQSSNGVYYSIVENSSVLLFGTGSASTGDATGNHTRVVIQANEPTSGILEIEMSPFYGITGTATATADIDDDGTDEFTWSAGQPTPPLQIPMTLQPGTPLTIATRTSTSLGSLGLYVNFRARRCTSEFFGPLSPNLLAISGPNPPDSAIGPASCLGTSVSVNSSFDGLSLTVQNVDSGSVAALVFGFTAPTAPVSLPGPGGCVLRVSPDVVMPLQADATGTASMTLVPPPGSTFGLQTVLVDTIADTLVVGVGRTVVCE